MQSKENALREELQSKEAEKSRLREEVKQLQESQQQGTGQVQHLVALLVRTKFINFPSGHLAWS